MWAAVLKGLVKFDNDPLHMVDGQPGAEEVILGDEDDPDCWEFLELNALGNFPRVDEAGIEPGPLGTGTFVSPLDLYIIDFAIAIHGEDIEAYTAAVEIVGRALCDHLLYDDVCAVEEDTQQELHAFDAAIEAHVEEGIIDKAELLDGLQIFGIEAGVKYAQEASSFLCIL